LTFGQYYQGNISLIALPFLSYHAAIPGWTIIAVQCNNKATAAQGQYQEIANGGFYPVWEAQLSKFEI
jgi:hypothetical protein